MSLVDEGLPSAARAPRQRASHARLISDATLAVPPPRSSRRARLDAIVVPTSRPGSQLKGAIDLSVRQQVPLVFLCSRAANIGQIAARVSETAGAKALVVEVPPAHDLESLQHQTSAAQYREASAGRDSDLSLKRNIGLLLARAQGWNKIAFLDDDIVHVRGEDVARLAGQLEDHAVAGMIVRRFPDNSVVCHARRLAGLAQDNFVSGAVLGVNCADHPLPFFPDIYNEDWFFFARSAAKRALPCVGQARQAEYDPFRSPERARGEEFGDLLAEGLFSLLGDGNPWLGLTGLLRSATPAYWDRFIQARRDTLLETETRLLRLAQAGHGADSRIYRALASLKAATEQLTKITPALCAEYVLAWQWDMQVWERDCMAANTVPNIWETFDRLGLKSWQAAEFGNPDVRYTSWVKNVSGRI